MPQSCDATHKKFDQQCKLSKHASRVQDDKEAACRAAIGMGTCQYTHKSVNTHVFTMSKFIAAYS